MFNGIFASQPATGLQEISTMLTYCRPAGSKTEKRFISNFITPLEMERDDLGNLYKRIGRAPILWSCHTDTVHLHKGFQTIMIQDGVAKLADKESRCLGADDTAGVWLMMEMIRAKVEGLYIFHRAEEVGGRGSSYMARSAANMLKEYKFAVALDRRGTDDVITHQAAGRCCSDKFAKSLAVQLGENYKPSDDGIFTDTANYTDLIGECTNVSVGYHNEHRPTEVLDTTFLQSLRDRLCQLDVSKLDCERKPGEQDDDYYDWISYGGTKITSGKKNNIIRSTTSTKSWVDDYFADPEYGRTGTDPYYELRSLVTRYPDVAADILEQSGYTAEDFRDWAGDIGH